MPNLSSHIQTFSVLDAPYAGHDMQFEDIAGYYTVLSGGSTLIFFDGAWYAASGPGPGDTLTLIKKDLLPLYSYAWNKRRQLRLRLESMAHDDPTGWCFLLTGNPHGPWTGFGLVFTPTEIIARCGDGFGFTDLVLFTGLTPGNMYTHLYEFIFYPGNGVYVYVDGVLIGSITLTLPSGTIDSERLLYIDMYTDTLNKTKQLGFSRIQFSQDK